MTLGVFTIDTVSSTTKARNTGIRQTKNQVFDAAEEINHSLVGPRKTYYQMQVRYVHPVLKELSDQSNNIVNLNNRICKLFQIINKAMSKCFY